MNFITTALSPMPDEKPNIIRGFIDSVRRWGEERSRDKLGERIGRELDHAVLNLEPEQGRQHVENLLVEMRERFNWEVGARGVSREEERLLGAYDFGLTFPIEQRRERLPAILEDMLDTYKIRLDEIPNMSVLERQFIRELGFALGQRPEEKAANRQRSREGFIQKAAELGVELPPDFVNPPSEEIESDQQQEPI